MNVWKEIWVSYSAEATFSRLFKNVWVYASYWDRVYIFFCMIFLLVSFVLFIGGNSLWVFIAAFLEMLLLVKFVTIKTKLVLNEYGEYKDSKVPPTDESHQATRYYMFKTWLKKKHVTKSHVRDCFELVETQIDIAAHKITTSNRVMTFTLGLLSGVLMLLWGKLDIKILTQLAVTLIGASLLVSVVYEMFPSRVEKLKEMKYFMQLYCQEVE